MSNDLTMTSPAYGAGKFGTALTSGSGLSTAYPTGTAFTFEIFFKTTNSGATTVMFSEDGNYLGLDTNGKILGFGTTVTSTTSYNDGVWHHAEVDGSASGVTIFVDGAVVAAGSVLGLVTGKNLTIGRHQTFGFNWVGGLDEFASWSITRHTAAFTPPAAAYASGLANMVQLYHFDGDGSDSAAAVAAPIAPTIGTATPGAGGGQVSVAFTPSGSGGAAAIFTATWTPSTGAPVTASGTSSPIVITGLTNGIAGTAHVTATNTNSTSAASAESSSVTPAVQPNFIAITDTKVRWSDYNWDNPTGQYKISQYAGATAKAAFGGTSFTIGVDVSAMSAFAAGSYPIVRTIVDEVSFVDTQLTSGMTSITRSGLASGAHTIEICLLAFDENAGDFWPTLVNAVRITGFTLDSGSVATQYPGRPNIMRYDGDSISRGFMALGTTTAMPAGNSALHGIPFSVAKAFNAELGLVAFTGQGYEQAGNGAVPAWPSTWDKYSAGRSRLTNGLLVPQPTHWCQEMGTNGTTTQADVQAMFTNMRGAAPNASIYAIVPANGFGRAALTAAVAAQGDSKIFLIDIGTAYSSGISAYGSGPNMWSIDGLHRNILCNARVGPAVVKAMQSAQPALSTRTVSFTVANAAGAMANQTGLQVSIFDDPTRAVGSPIRYQTLTGTTDASGVFTTTYQSALPSGGTCGVDVRGAGLNMAINPTVL